MDHSRKVFSLFAMFLFALLCAVSTVAADLPRVAVLDFKITENAIAAAEADYLSDVVRGVARKMLSADRYIVMTKENIFDMLPPGQGFADCSDAECAVQAGRMVGADYVITGDILKFGNELKISLMLHETEHGNLLSTRRVSGADVNALESPLEMDTETLFLPLGGFSKPGPPNEGAIGEEAGQPWSASMAADVVVKFESDPEKATVEIGDQPLCETPCSRPLAAGNYTVAMKKMKYFTKRENVEVRTEMKPLAWTLAPNFGWLTITSEPSGLAVKIDGKEAGNTPITDKMLDPGSYEVLVSDPRYYDKGERITLKAGEQRTIAVSLTPRQGGIKVSAVDASGNAVQGEVYVDGAIAGKTYAPITLLIGSHEVEVRSTSGSWKGTVEVAEKQVAAVTAKLAGGSSGQATPGSGSTAGMVLIPGGSFQMGCVPGDSECEADEKPRHRVTVSSFYMDTYEVTQSEYEKVMGKNPSGFKDCGGNCPVESVSWNGAKAYCEKTGKRLPTEAEWEYAARGGLEGKIYPWGDAKPCSQANFCDSNCTYDWKDKSCNDGHKSTSPVGSYQPNGYGLYDMSGNVWEWCNDWYDKDYYSNSPADNATGASSSQYRVLRGGSWTTDSWYLRVSNRLRFTPSSSYGNFGFRCVRGQ